MPNNYQQIFHFPSISQNKAYTYKLGNKDITILYFNIYYMNGGNTCFY